MLAGHRQTAARLMRAIQELDVEMHKIEKNSKDQMQGKSREVLPGSIAIVVGGNGGSREVLPGSIALWSEAMGGIIVGCNGGWMLLLGDFVGCNGRGAVWKHSTGLYALHGCQQCWSSFVCAHLWTSCNISQTLFAP
eukprot:scaffold61570_cov17-Tisochrysis_lutea.AAC.2